MGKFNQNERGINKMKDIETLTGEIFEAVRNDEKLGRGSCSTYDECYEDDELKGEITEDLAEGTYSTVKSALKWFKKLEGIRAERENEFSGW